jgi:alpha-beta hydrolase superfamily lysophospholipase
MQAQEIKFMGAGEISLFARLWEPEVSARALVVITHGHGEHSGRYVHVGRALAERGIAIAALDWRGHGLSEGPRGFVRRWEDYREDLVCLIAELNPTYGSKPHFLYGHSVGGTVSLDYVMHYPDLIKGVILSAPSLGKPNIPAILFSISKVLSKIYPTFSMATQLDQTALSRDPKVVKAYQEDPLVHSVGTARLGTELLKTAEWIQEHAPDLQIPLLLIHGAQDRLISPIDSKRFFENAGSIDKTYMELPDGFHEPHNDLDKDVVITRVGDWIESHL